MRLFGAKVYWRGPKGRWRRIRCGHVTLHPHFAPSGGTPGRAKIVAYVVVLEDVVGDAAFLYDAAYEAAVVEIRVVARWDSMTGVYSVELYEGFRLTPAFSTRYPDGPVCVRRRKHGGGQT